MIRGAGVGVDDPGVSTMRPLGERSVGTKTLVGCSVTPLVLTGLALAAIVWGAGSYVGITKQEVRVEQAWSQMENAWLHRKLMIPDLFDLARAAGVADDERMATWTEMEDRVAEFVLTPALLDDDERFREFLEAQSRLQGAVQDLLERHGDEIERYSPDVYERLAGQMQAAGARLDEGRRKFNAAVEEYNRSISRYPRKIVATVFDFRPRVPCELPEAGS